MYMVVLFGAVATMFKLNYEQNNPDLRRELDQITNRFVGDSVGQQIKAIADLNQRFGHDIVLEAEASPSDPGSWKYTCFQHAFKLVEPPPLIKRIANFNKQIYPNSEFVTFLVHKELKAVAPDKVEDGDVVVYSSEGSPKHAGKCQSGRVVSKWGEMHLWRHRLFEVPLRYGNTIQFYHSISRSQSIKAFLEYAKSKLGVAIIDSLSGALLC